MTAYTIDEKKIIYADLDPKEGVVLNLDTKNYYRLNETGQIIWRSLAAGKNPDQIAEALCVEYDIERATALSDVTEIVEQMKQEKLIG